MKQTGMWLFVLSDSLTFAALLVVYTVLRLGAPQWPHPFSFSPAILYATGMTAVLLTSSLTMVWAVEAMRAAARARAALWMAATALGGALFIVLHLSEWRHLYNADSIRPATAFGSVFYGITGLHMAHVACGIIYLLVLAVGVSRGRFRAEDVETGGLFWHFVDVVWMFVFPVVYLMAVRA